MTLHQLKPHKIPFKSIRLVAFDLDGTLLNDKNEISNHYAKKIITSLQKNNIQMTIATGRTLTGAINAINKLELLNTPVALYNGSLVINPHSNEILYHSQIPEHTVNKIALICNKIGINIFIYRYTSTSNTHKEVVLSTSHEGTRKSEYNEMMPILWDINTNNGAATSIIIDTKKNSNSVIAKLSKITNISITHSNHEFVEIRPKGANKATAVEVIAQKLNIKTKETMAIGDNDNDVELLKWAGIGVAVKNSSFMASSAADLITNNNSQEGVIEALKLIQFSKA